MRMADWLNTPHKELMAAIAMSLAFGVLLMTISAILNRYCDHRYAHLTNPTQVPHVDGDNIVALDPANQSKVDQLVIAGANIRSVGITQDLKNLEAFNARRRKIAEYVGSM
jgi:hypothetical protein